MDRSTSSQANNNQASPPSTGGEEVHSAPKFKFKVVHQLPPGAVSVPPPRSDGGRSSTGAVGDRIRRYRDAKELAELTARNTEFNKNIKCKSASLLRRWHLASFPSINYK